MSLLVIGMNHKTASVAIREQVAFVPEMIHDFLKLAQEKEIAKGIVVLSTCNRTEFYIDQLSLSHQGFFDLWIEFTQIQIPELMGLCYLYEEDDVCLHLFKVAAGLDSLVLGEPQIMGQLKDALHCSMAHSYTTKHLNRLFQLAFYTAKNIRTETNIGAFTVSVAYTAVQLARQIFDLNTQKVLLVGAGETIELVARHMIEAGVKTLSVANRTKKHAEMMAENLQTTMEIYDLPVLPHLIEHADIIISSTAANEILITKEMAQLALKKRKNKPILMVDIAVPRDIDESIGTLDDIYLYSVDDLNMIVEKNYQSREAAAKEAEVYLKKALVEWNNWCFLADIGDSINVLERYADEQKEITIKKINTLLNGEAAVDTALAQFANQLSNRLLHPMISIIKTLEKDGQQELVEKIVQEFTK